MAARVGLTGGIGCGKSTVCRLFRELGIATISADDIAHELMAVGTPQYAQIVDHFGAQILDENGAPHAGTRSLTESWALDRQRGPRR